ncbi:MAG: EFR1 family ferrodoxin [Proteobacteria bacterium]|nr:EFR1 family ferrodoxin [Pseudomonadota bacterium]
METRRTFLKKGVAAGVVLCAPACFPCEARVRGTGEFRSRDPKTALVLWYSQTGHTQRYGRLMGRVFQESGLTVHACDIRDCKGVRPADFDLVMAGTPVHYMDVPPNVRAWFCGLDRLDRTPVASYATFGGPGDNQHNTAHTLLTLMVEKGGVPAGIATFGNMSTYAPTWSMGNEARTLKYRHLPDASTYDQVAGFARAVLARVRQGEVDSPEREFDFADWAKHLPMVGICKLLTTDHRIIEDKCIGCGICRDGCPVGAIDPDHPPVDTKKCVLCLGCVNNCPQGAVNMKYLGKKVYGFPEFLRQQDIKLLEPDIPKESGTAL